MYISRKTRYGDLGWYSGRISSHERMHPLLTGRREDEPSRKKSRDQI
jgi:hypothetical protein